MKRSSSRLLITPGDPNGIGPEISLKALLDPKFPAHCGALLVAWPEVIEKAAKRLGIDRPVEERFEEEGEALFSPTGASKRKISVIRPQGPRPSGLIPGTIQAQAGKVAFRSLVRAHGLIDRGFADALVTGPIHKEALHKAGYARVAHTEILAHLCRRQDPVTLFESGPLRIAFFTRHLPLKEAIRAVRKKPLVRFVLRLAKTLESLGISSPRLALAALNPHAGEGGLLGKEEQRELGPAVKDLKSQGLSIEGPIPADSVFSLAREGAFDCVISLYHDQGHIAAKSTSLLNTISLTLGLPYLRTSVDHGTALDIAWRGKASSKSMILAILTAHRYCGKFKPAHI